jgi:glycosyltransferase involved in cell wall biosynthesis
MITAIIPTLNEAHNIADAIASLSFADEIIVIDSYSEDNTVEIASRHGVRILQRQFDNFSNQKNFAIDQASHDWIFVLDADERVSPDLRNEILACVRQPKSRVGFYVYRSFYYGKSRIRFGGWQTDKVIRLFKKNDCRYDGKLVHERITYNGNIGFLANRLDHYSFRDIEHYSQKLDFYARLRARELELAGLKIPMGYRWFKPGFRFFVHYFIRLGFLDGYKGFVLARLHAGAVNQRYVELDQLRNAKTVSPQI